jgi:hypothetical protein
MDKRLKYSEQIFNLIKTDLSSIEVKDITFEIWNEIPSEFLNSYYENEKQINPVVHDFDSWQENIVMRPNPTYSVALSNNLVVSSVYLGTYPEKSLNLWHTNKKYRGMKIGKGVLLNLLKTTLEIDNESQIVAWDITSKEVDNVLNKYGFK